VVNVENKAKSSTKKYRIKKILKNIIKMKIIMFNPLLLLSEKILNNV
jgi:hypothetical protein